jgi:flagellar operon protein
VDVKKISGFEQLTPTSPAGGKAPAGTTGPSFRDTMDRLGSLQSPVNPKAPGAATSAANGMNAKDGVKFSNHAIERMKTRGITFTPEDMTRLSDAVGKAAAKGSKDSLILMNDSALIVSVKNNTVVTVMDKNALKENVFTNIDSTIVM